MNRILTTGVLVLLLVLGAGGCATKKDVAKGFAQVEQNMQELESSIEDSQTRIAANEQEIRDQDGRIVQVSDETKAALARIEEVEDLAMGKLLYEVMLNNDAVKFDSGKAALSESGKAIIDELVQRLKVENRDLFVEIQGHTDATGSVERNQELGLERAEAVRRYMSMAGVPLHRMSVISYGETEPMTDNRTREGRRSNRRVVILVLE
jgi:peptidoglycan-associated lipoprotein